MLIKNARDTIINQLIVKLLGRQPDVVGSRMAFYLIVRIFNSGQIQADDALKFAQAYNTTIESLKKDGVIAQKDGIMHLQDLKRTMDHKPDLLDPQNLYQQLCYLASHPSDVASLLHHERIRANDLKPIVDLLLKNHSMKRSQNPVHASSNREEIEILTGIATHMGIRTDTGDIHAGSKTTKQRTSRTIRHRGDEDQSRLDKWK